jgi:hypothetical protein
MVDEEDIELVRTGYSAFVAGDKEWLNEHLHVNVVWHAAGKGSRAGEYRGREEVLASFANSVQIATPEFEIPPSRHTHEFGGMPTEVPFKVSQHRTFEGLGVLRPWLP